MDTVASLIDLAKGFGSAAPVIGLLLWLYWNERKERVDLSAKVMTLSSQVLQAMNDNARAMEMLSLKVGAK